MFEGLFTPQSAHGQTYIPRERLGSGQYSGVYLGYNSNDLDQPVALKFILLEGNAQLRNNLIIEEAAFLKSHQHPNFTQYLDHSVNNINPYLVMELLPETLAQKVTTRGITQPIIELYLTQISAILQELAAKDQIHGDLRTKNIGIKDNLLKVLDPLPSICKIKPCQDKRSWWYAPENKENIYLPASDMYTLGKNIEHLLVGKLFESPEQAYDHIEIYHDCELPQEFKQLHTAMTNPNPHKRPTLPQLDQLLTSVIEIMQEKEYFFKKDLF